MKISAIIDGAAVKDAPDMDLETLATAAASDPDGIRRALAEDADRAALLVFFHVARAERPAQIALAEALGQLGGSALEAAVEKLFATLAHHPAALRAFFTGVQAGGHEAAFAPMIRAWIAREVGPEQVEAMMREGGRFTESAGIERAAKALTEAILELPAGTLRDAAVQALEETLAGDSSWGAGALRERVREAVR